MLKIASIAALSTILALESCKTYTPINSNDALLPSEIISQSRNIIGHHVTVFGYIALGNSAEFFSGHEIFDSASIAHEKDTKKIVRNIRCCCINIINPSFIYKHRQNYQDSMRPLSGIIVDDRDDVDNACHGQVALKLDE